MKYPRQKIHFTTPKGWCNDPNGLVKIDGTYHLFYQYYPEDTKWGPMHWGHAVSKNLLTWEPLPTALFPNDEEYCFSGSAVLDKNNVSGLGKPVSSNENCPSAEHSPSQNPPLLLFYTAHNPSNGRQTQCLAYSTDYVHFEKYSGNPIVDNPLSDNVPEKKDFRDPKVVPNPAGSGWIMVLAAGEKIEFWKSENLLSWTYSGSFTPGNYALGGICECPDLLDFGKFGSSENKIPVQVLTMSMITWDKEGKEHHAMQYFAGRFDGNTFVDVIPAQNPLLLDYGNRNYAAVTFSNTEPGSYIMMGWAEDWKEARENDAEEWFGKMTLPRKVELVFLENASGEKQIFRLRQTPVFNFPLPTENESLWISRTSLETGETFSRSGVFITLEEKHIKINGKRIPRENGKLLSDGTAAAANSSSSELTVIFDHGLFEIFADGGLTCYSGETHISHRRALHKDIPAIMEVIHDAQALLKADGLPQWQDGFPNEETIAEDIETRRAFVICENDEIIGFVVVAFGEEPDYSNNVRGTYKYNEPYGTIHRCAFSASAKGKGLSQYMFNLCYEEIRSEGVKYVRIDTHQDNLRMRHIMEREGFTESAVISLLANGKDRIVAEKAL